MSLTVIWAAILGVQLLQIITTRMLIHEIQKLKRAERSASEEDK